MGAEMHNPRHVAAALRALADDVDAIGNRDLPGVRVRVSVLVPTWAGNPAERMAAVDFYAAGFGTEANVSRTVSTGEVHHATPYAAARHGVDVGVFTSVPEMTTRPAPEVA